MKTVRRIWRRGKACIATGLPVDVSSRIPGRVGRKRVQFDPNQMKEIPLRRRTNIRSLSKALNIPKSTLHKRIKKGYYKEMVGITGIKDEYPSPTSQYELTRIAPTILADQQ
ncbi:hypothetical protein Vadar_004953 [Vaccinium darrowii]|uniref:Uncharacterized protein n=1 Tax=Vaccinium darrowii TaxID=229202 RepID=A0ACB7XPE2_9ERIC|nr:hypothetical protein Vadar_004953 [Vaccinium darrowii]